jgi:uncharacterized protein (DUF2384 family)
VLIVDWLVKYEGAGPICQVRSGTSSDMIWKMTEFQIESIEAPLLESGEAATLALALVARAQTMGFLPAREGHRVELSRDFLNELAELLRQQGVAAVATGSLQRATRAEPLDDVEITAALRATLEAVDASPRPHAEWTPTRNVVGDELLARLLRISVTSVRRYASGDRRTPDEVAWRLHLVARVLAALVGSYNDYGVRRWFERRRSALDDATPAELLEQAESEDDVRVQRVIGLADELSGAAAAA